MERSDSDDDRRCHVKLDHDDVYSGDHGLPLREEYQACMQS